MESPILWTDTLPLSRRRSIMARLEARHAPLADLEAEAVAAPGAIARTVLELQATPVRRAISELEAELASI
jgi:hypothetical protein